MKKKLKDRSGETLAEVLVGILIVASASSLFLSMASVSGTMNETAREWDERFYRTMSLLECWDAEEGVAKQGERTVTVSFQSEGEEAEESFEVDAYSGDGMISYRLK